jgi:hypothetical protein
MHIAEKNALLLKLKKLKKYLQLEKIKLERTIRTSSQRHGRN